MFAAVGEAGELISLILRAFSLFRTVSSIQKIETVLNSKRAKKLLELYEKSRDYANFLIRQFSQNLRTHQFIFFSEEELKEYIKRIDPTAKILKIFEGKEVDLYLIKIKSFKLLLNEKNNKIVGFFNFLEDLVLFSIFTNNFYLTNLENIKKINEELKKDVDNIFSKMENDLNNKINNLKNDISTIIDYYKQQDIENTYCESCSCSCCCDCNINCECEDSSYTESCSCCCSCSCNCDLVHYTQSWENTRNEIINKINNFYNDFRKELENKKNKLKKDLDFYLIDMENENSLMFLFIELIKELLEKISNDVPFTFLCAVIKRKIKKIRELYEFLRKNYYMKKVEKKELYKAIKDYFYMKYNISLSDNQISQYLSIIKRRYLKIFKYKIRGKWYYFIGWNPRKSHLHKKRIEVV